MKLLFTLLLLTKASATPSTIQKNLPRQIEESPNFKYSSFTLPKPLSDMTATYLPSTSKIYIVGGCDSAKGNERASFDQTLFICTSTSSSAYMFDPIQGVIETLAEMPRERYRHAASNVDGKIWVVGGRDVDGNVIREVDVYDPNTNTWSTPTTLPRSKITSDLGSFSYGNSLYLVGGYDKNYTASSETFKLNTETLEHKNMAKMPIPKGDLLVERIDDYAYGVGGFTHENGFCEALAVTERYNIADDTWEVLDSLDEERGDQAMVAMDGFLITLGGETKIACEDKSAVTSAAIETVEILNTNENDAKWETIDKIHDSRFRFAAEAFPEKSTIYTFGGQTAYDKDCDCYEASDLIGEYKVDMSALSTNDGGSRVVMSVGWMVGVMTLFGIML